MNRTEAFELLQENIKNVNLQRHCIAVEAVMKALAAHFNENEDEWGLVGILHDLDYEKVKETAQIDHTFETLKILKDNDLNQDVRNAIARHAFGYVENAPEPVTKMDWSLYCCDELTGFIVAVALIKPEKKLSAVNLESLKKKWNQKSFAAGVDRKQIEMCEEKLGIKLDDFVEIALSAMQNISTDLGL